MRHLHPMRPVIPLSPMSPMSPMRPLVARSVKHASPQARGCTPVRTVNGSGSPRVPGGTDRSNCPPTPTTIDHPPRPRRTTRPNRPPVGESAFPTSQLPDFPASRLPDLPTFDDGGRVVQQDHGFTVDKHFVGLVDHASSKPVGSPADVLDDLTNAPKGGARAGRSEKLDVL